MNLFDLADAAGNTKKDLFAEDPIASESAYVPWMVNKQFSYFPDTVLYANTMNLYPDLPKEAQFQFYRGLLPPRRRFSKWYKPAEDPRLDAISSWYGINKVKASEILSVLKKEDVDEIVMIVGSGEREGAERLSRNRAKGSRGLPKD